MTNFRTWVFKTAYKLKEKGFSFSEALRQAWRAYRVKRDMKKGSVTFTFKKKSGELRKAVGTLLSVDHLIKGTGVERYGSVAYFDLDVNGFRSFNVEGLIYG